MIDNRLFFDKVRESLFDGHLSQPQVDGINALLAQCKSQGVTDKRQIAYILATAYHEVSKTMQPIQEHTRGKNKTYGHRIKLSGKEYKDTPHIYYGRGFVQCTWYENYDRLTKMNPYGWDFLHNPSLMLEVGPSAWCCVYGMRKGIFTGKSLALYFNDEVTDYTNARKIVNGKDRAELIAGYAKLFKAALTE